MKRNRNTTAQVGFALKWAESSMLGEQISRWMAISEPTFYRSKNKFLGMGVAEVGRWKQLDDENEKLKQLVADLSVDRSMLQQILAESGEARPPRGDRGLSLVA